MEKKNIDKKRYYVVWIIAWIWCIFSCRALIQIAYQSQANNLPEIQKAIEANTAFTKQEYEKALELISGTKDEDYYNRGTIQTVLAYKYGVQNSVSWLELAQTYINEAQQSFELAKKLSSQKNILQAIHNNQQTVGTVSTVIDIKTCYSIGQGILTNMTNVIDTLQSIKSTLDTEIQTINSHKKNLETICYQKLQTIADISKQQIDMLDDQMQQNRKKHTSDFSDKKENPLLCIQSPYDNTIPFIEKGKKWLESYQQQHQSTIEALQSQNKTAIQELCNQAKNDSQIQEKLDTDIQEMIQKTEKNQKEPTTVPWQTTEYKNFLWEDEKKILQEIISSPRTFALKK